MKKTGIEKIYYVSHINNKASNFYTEFEKPKLYTEEEIKELEK